MRIAQIRRMDITNGPGIRVSLFTQGCRIKCEGCFNHSIWDYNGGKEWNKETFDSVMRLCASEHISGISILGGEPLSDVNLKDLSELIIEFRNRYPDKTVWMWTGYIYENLSPEQKEIADMADVLVDGPWIASLGDFNLKFRGSSNQRIIDIKKTLEQKKVVTLDM